MKLARALAVLAACLIAGNVAATQYLAHAFGYAPALGEPLVAVAGVAVYPPGRGSTWARMGWHASSRDRSVAFGLLLAGPCVGSILASRVLWRRRARIRLRTVPRHGRVLFARR